MRQQVETDSPLMRKLIREYIPQANEHCQYQFVRYYELLIDYNNRMNLTAITDFKEIVQKHFIDSAAYVFLPDVSRETSEEYMIDVGTGAGFPGLVLKIVFPNLKVTLVDSLNKRIIFLKSVIEKLNLKGIDAIHERIEDYAKTSRESFDIVTSRAVASLPVLSEMCIPLVCEKGLFIPMKADAKDEIKSSQNAIKTLGGVLRDTILFKLPKDAGERTLIIIEKINKTSVKYPRKFSEIKKKPL